MIGSKMSCRAKNSEVAGWVRRKVSSEISGSKVERGGQLWRIDGLTQQVELINEVGNSGRAIPPIN